MSSFWVWISFSLSRFLAFSKRKRKRKKNPYLGRSVTVCHVEQIKQRVCFSAKNIRTTPYTHMNFNIWAADKGITSNHGHLCQGKRRQKKKSLAQENDTAAWLAMRAHNLSSQESSEEVFNICSTPTRKQIHTLLTLRCIRFFFFRLWHNDGTRLGQSLERNCGREKREEDIINRRSPSSRWRESEDEIRWRGHIEFCGMTDVQINCVLWVRQSTRRKKQHFRRGIHSVASYPAGTRHIL